MREGSLESEGSEGDLLGEGVGRAGGSVVDRLASRMFAYEMQNFDAERDDYWRVYAGAILRMVADELESTFGDPEARGWDAGSNWDAARFLRAAVARALPPDSRANTGPPAPPTEGRP